MNKLNDIMKKKCYRCKIEYPINQIRRNGYCIECQREYRRIQYKKNKEKEKEYREKNREKINKYLKKYYNDNKNVLNEKYKNNRKLYYEKNKKEKIKKQVEARRNNFKYKEYSKRYYLDNKDKINEYTRKWMKRKRSSNLEYKIKQNLRGRLTSILKYQGIKKYKSTMNLIGCDVNYLKEYLESKFLPTMTWENYGKYWHIDHIIPCSHFDLTKKEEQIKCFHYTNLQPLFAVTQMINGVEYIGNLNKNNKYEY